MKYIQHKPACKHLNETCSMSVFYSSRRYFTEHTWTLQHLTHKVGRLWLRIQQLDLFLHFSIGSKWVTEGWNCKGFWIGCSLNWTFFPMSNFCKNVVINSESCRDLQIYMELLSADSLFYSSDIFWPLLKAFTALLSMRVSASSAAYEMTSLRIGM